MISLVKSLFWSCTSSVAIWLFVSSTDVSCLISSLLAACAGMVITVVLWSMFTWTYDSNVVTPTNAYWNAFLPGTRRNKSDNHFSVPSFSHSGFESLDNSIEQVIVLAIRDFILDWYNYYFDDNIFPRLVYEQLNVFMCRLCERMKTVNWTRLVAININSVVAMHVKIFIKAITIVENSDSHVIFSKLQTEFFKLESKSFHKLSHKVICTNPLKETEYLTFFVEALLFLLVSEANFNDKALRYIIRDVLVSKILLPTIDYICDPDFINQCIHSQKSDAFYTSEHFISAIRISCCKEDIIELLKSIHAEITVLSGNDMDEKEFEDMTKKQISSLLYIKRLSLAQLESIRSTQKSCGSAYKRMGRIPSFEEKSDTELPQVPIKNLLENPHAFPFLLDYFQGIGDDQVLFMYGDIKSVFETFSPLLSSEEYQKKALFFNDSRLLSLRETVLHLMEDYKKLLETKSIKFINGDLFDHAIKEAKATIPGVGTLKEIQKEVLNYLQEPAYLKQFYSSKKYYKLCIELKFIKPKPKNRPSEKELYLVLSELFNKTFSLDLMISDSITCGPANNRFSVYIIQAMVIAKDLELSWVIHRRFSHFVEFHDFLVTKFPVVENISFPEKKFFGSRTAENIKSRKLSLNKFMKALLDHELFRKSRAYFDIIITFLDQKKWAILRSPAANEEKNIPENLESYDEIELNKSFFEQILSKNFIQNLDVEDIESVALSIIVNLVEEVFDVKNKKPWLTRFVKTLLKEAFMVAFGDRIGRKIVDQIAYLFSVENVTSYVHKFRESLWPGNCWAAGIDCPRTGEIKCRQRIVSTAVLIGMVPNELRRIIGDDVTLDGVSKLFNMLQIKQLNKRLFYTILETVTEAMLPNNTFGNICKNLNEFYSQNER